MKATGRKYSEFALVAEMLETVKVMADFDAKCVTAMAKEVGNNEGIFFTGEGSSRIFPGKHAISKLEAWGTSLRVGTQGARQAAECNLKGMAVLGASNSGKTAELIDLYRGLKKKRHDATFGLTANRDTMLEGLSKRTHVLTCGKEDAVAATKSVVEQALFAHALVASVAGKKTEMSGLKKAAAAVKEALEMKIPAKIIKKVAAARNIFFAGRNNGVAEELTLKTMEITRKPSSYFEGTYAVHGVEEVLTPEDVVVVVDPYEAEIEKFRQCLEKGVGLTLVAISDQKLSIPTVQIPSVKNFDAYIQLVAGWNLLVEVGLECGVDLDKPVRARKIGNEAAG